MPRPEYKDDKTKTVYLEKVEPAIKEDFLDICYKLDKSQSEAFQEIVRFYYAANKMKARPSRKKA